MKNYICDFCDAVDMGYKQFKKEFTSVRHARKLAKQLVPGSNIGIGVSDPTSKMIKHIRETAGSNYDPKKALNPKE